MKPDTTTIFTATPTCFDEATHTLHTLNVLERRRYLRVEGSEGGCE